MEEISTYVGLDVHAGTISACALAAGTDGEELFAGTMPATPEAMGRLIAKVKKRGRALFCYEAGACGYGIYRQTVAAGERCLVIAPSLIPRKTGERVKTDRRDTRKLARLLRAGELSAIWVPGEADEAMRDLIRARHEAVRLRVAAQQRLQSFLLRQRRYWSGRRWTLAHRAWLATQEFSEPAHRFLFKHLMDGIADAQGAIKRVQNEMLALLPQWRLGPLVQALRALRGIDVIGAATLAAAIGDPRRFASAPAFMAYLGLVPSEHSSGAKRRQGSITKTGEGQARRILIEAAWCQRVKPRPGKAKQELVASQPQKIREIAKICEARLHKRSKKMLANGKRSVTVTTAIAREQAGFVWAVAREVVLPA